MTDVSDNPDSPALSVEVVVFGDTAGEIMRKAQAVLSEFFGDMGYSWTATCRALTLNDGSIVHYEAEISGKIT